MSSSFACAENTGDFRFLSLADIHFDPFIGCYHLKQRPCPLLKTLQASPVSAWPALLKAGDTEQAFYGLDTGYPLLTKMLSEAKLAAEKNHVAFVWVLGDFLGHDFKKYYRKYSLDKSIGGYQAFANQTLDFVTQQIVHAFPSVNVYPVLGNNDTTVGNYQTDPQGAFLAQTATRWVSLMQSPANQASFRQMFPYAGFYSVTPPKLPGIKIIVLNSVLFSVKSKRGAANQAAAAELDWLKQELKSAESHHQQVLIAMHIPPSVDVYAIANIRLFTLLTLWKPAMKDQFFALVNQHANAMAGIFTGHLHTSWNQAIKLANGRVIPMNGTVSVSPIFGNAPGFTLYQYNAETGTVEEGVTSDFSLAKAHLFGL